MEDNTDVLKKVNTIAEKMVERHYQQPRIPYPHPEKEFSVLNKWAAAANEILEQDRLAKMNPISRTFEKIAMAIDPEKVSKKVFSVTTVHIIGDRLETNYENVKVSNLKGRDIVIANNDLFYLVGLALDLYPKSLTKVYIIGLQKLNEMLDGELEKSEYWAELSDTSVKDNNKIILNDIKIAEMNIIMNCNFIELEEDKEKCKKFYTTQYNYKNDVDIKIKRYLLAETARHDAQRFLKNSNIMLEAGQCYFGALDYENSANLFNALALGYKDIPPYPSEPKLEYWRKTIIDRHILGQIEIGLFCEETNSIIDAYTFYADLSVVWEKRLKTSRLGIRFTNLDFIDGSIYEAIKELGDALCMSPLIKAYIAGISINDIFCETEL